MAGCRGCQGEVASPDFTMAFQPIVDVEQRSIYAYEALVRPCDGRAGGAAAVLGAVNEDNRYAFDQACRVRAIALAAQLRLSALLSINFLPNAVYQPAACLRHTFAAAREHGFPLQHLVFEVSESEPSRDPAHLKSIFAEYRRHGMLTAFDDFGAGHANLQLLAEFQPDVIKIDMALTRDIDRDPVRLAIAEAIVTLCRRLSIAVICEGIETLGEAATLRALGVRLFQGYLFARPEVERLPGVAPPVFDALDAAHADLTHAADEPGRIDALLTRRAL